jgi:transcriptional regulator with XRE-family HTH domain
MNIGDNIKKIRMAKGLSQKEVTISAGLDADQYSRIENGKTDPSVTTLERIAKAMNVSLAELFAATEELKEKFIQPYGSGKGASCGNAF